MKDVFHELYEKYHHDLFRFLFYMVKDRSLAEDLVQDVYVKVLKSFHSFKGESSEKTWLYSIARHVAIDYLRKQKRKKRRVMDVFNWDDKGDFIPDEKPLPEEIAQKNEEIGKMYQCLHQCTIDQQSVVILRYIQMLSIQETADVLGWTESKVKTTQHRAIKTLKKIMKGDEGGMHYEAR
ncbi:RNA polymerase sigma factor SigX [Salirhabdus salicampi]|uniref:RNA polymerase sigma factor SigX n=1 Tax=Salirhabdus salicampi TaxID=476102 RepID=UPI0020C44565|nr:RNA polymerase sigma factor SigX [Salirhabdus salicampi]MCP8616734.1 RNA polymerase sigma factor SigX [Salirhabdus salicampi]